MSTSREVNSLQSETMAVVNSHFAVVTEGEIFQMLTFLLCCVALCCVVPEFVYADKLSPSFFANSGF